jgi:DegV family protein with EDD domain
MNVAVVTDSAASLPNGAAERLGIVTVPLTLVLGGLVYADGDLDPDELMARSARDSVSTSSPSPGEFLKALATATEHEVSDAQVLILTVSSAMSATYEAALAAAAQVDDVEVQVVDTRTAAGAQGLVVMAAAELARAGAPLLAVMERAERVSAQVRLMASLSNLDHLARSGRVPGVAAKAGRSLSVRAMFEFAAGRARPRLPARSERGAFDRIPAALMQSRPSQPGKSGGEVTLRAAVLQAQAPDQAARLKGLVTEAVPDAEVFESSFSSVMIAHTGPGLVGLAWWWEERDGALPR